MRKHKQTKRTKEEVGKRLQELEEVILPFLVARPIVILHYRRFESDEGSTSGIDISDWDQQEHMRDR